MQGFGAQMMDDDDDDESVMEEDEEELLGDEDDALFYQLSSFDHHHAFLLQQLTIRFLATEVEKRQNHHQVGRASLGRRNLHPLSLMTRRL
jgi:hypothetical protein